MDYYLLIWICSVCFFLSGRKYHKKAILFLDRWEDQKSVIEHQIIWSLLTCILQHRMTAAWVPLMSLYLTVIWVHLFWYGCSHFSTWKNECIHMCEKHDYARVCKHAREKCVSFTVCLTALSLSVWMCVRMYARMMLGVEELGLSILDQHHRGWEDPVRLSWSHM